MLVNKIHFNLNRWAVSILILFIVIILTTLFWSINKGIDLSDEGLHFAFSNPNTINNNGLFNYDLFFKILYKITKFEFSIISLRLLKLSSLVLLFVLGLPFFRRSNFSVLDKSFLAVAIFSCYTYLTQSLSYNTISFVLVLSYIYMYTNLQKSSAVKQYLWSFLMAILSSLCFFVKPPLSIVLLGMTFVLTTISLSEFKWKDVIFKFSLIVLGYVSVQMVFQIIFSDYAFLRVLKDSLQISTYYGAYDKSILIKRIVASFKWVFILNIVGYIAAYLLNKATVTLKAKVISLLAIAVLLAYFFVSHRSSNEFDVFQYGLMIMTSIAIGFFIYFIKVQECSWHNRFIIILLFLAPFLCAFGSNVYFFRTSQQYLFFWFLLLVYSKSIGNKMPKRYILTWYFIFASFISAKIYNNVIANPDNQPKLSTNFVVYKYGNDKWIKLEKNQADYLKNLKVKLTHWSPSRKEIIGMYAMPGDIMLTGFINYYNPLIWDTFQWKFLKDRLNNNPKFKNQPMPILISKDLNVEERNKLENYKVVDSLKYFKNGYVYIFKPV